MKRNPIVIANDIDSSESRAVSISTSSTVLSLSRLGKTRRTKLAITNISPTTVYIVKGSQGVKATTAGIPLAQNQSLFESDDAGSDCWQDEIAAIGSAASTVNITETFMNPANK